MEAKAKVTSQVRRYREQERKQPPKLEIKDPTKHLHIWKVLRNEFIKKITGIWHPKSNKHNDHNV